VKFDSLQFGFGVRRWKIPSIYLVVLSVGFLGWENLERPGLSEPKLYLERLSGAESGAGQRDMVGTAFPIPLKVRVVDSDGFVRPGIRVEFTSVGDVGSAHVQSPVAYTDEKGIAATRVIMGKKPGKGNVRAHCPQCSNRKKTDFICWEERSQPPSEQFEREHPAAYYGSISFPVDNTYDRAGGTNPLRSVRLELSNLPPWLRNTAYSILGPLDVPPGETMTLRFSYDVLRNPSSSEAAAEIHAEIKGRDPDQDYFTRRSCRISTRNGLLSYSFICRDKDGKVVENYVYGDAAAPALGR